MTNLTPVRTAFYISDSTAITAETLGHSLLAQFEDVPFRQIRIPFVDSPEKAREAAQRINQAAREDGLRPLVFTTQVDPAVNGILRESDAFCMSLFEVFIAPLEAELGVKSTHTIGRSHSQTDSNTYQHRLEAINFALGHDDGVTMSGLDEASVILVGVSRCGKTPTSLYLAMQFGVKAANYPLIPEDFERGRLPEGLERYRDRLFGLTIEPVRLHQIRSERRPNSRYAALENCRQEVADAERLMRRENIRWLDSTSKSIEEISTTIMQEIDIHRHPF
ncbi:kinase/pyrophosphorylase [Rhodocyclus tenuis]|uniref:Putative phosphoenolpyruvate synthase regulatory protein n=2 Tax=Rhodocyclus TaxID=1064 RepID=A0A6L5JT51_RHOTE|nr:pyruvate, water dikinase regulatory protein [Rhodocyclus gracilis]MQY50399.1 pyruvate, phosphate dikinase/phosphoenolpyruvate synthase regulator [Rhodocyclus gracilis]MRD71704.1 pyruvate, phosphate dikinase/phosphoenolpyruvate synthase regulator [Rhodocyclus gracilis]NJA87902.1 kinase/pyrophosphorylase [Rhodocyclus gracilis]